MARTHLVPTWLGLLPALLPAPALAQQVDTVDVGILVDQIRVEDEPRVTQLMAEVQAVVGADAVVRFNRANILEHSFDVTVAEAQYQQLVDSSVDLVLAFGPVTARAVGGRETFPIPTILFGAVHNDALNFPTDRTTSGIDNFTYVVTSQSIGRDLDTFRSLFAFERLGVVVPAAQVGALDVEATLQRRFAGTDVEFEVIGYTTPEALDAHLERVDAVYLAEGWGISQDEIGSIAARLIDRRIPSFSAVRREDVEAGLMATNQAADNLNQFFRRIALHVEAVVAGQNLADRPVSIDLSETLTLNFNTAELVGVPLRYSLVANTQFVGDFINVLSERTYTLSDLVGEALVKNQLLQVDRRDVDLSRQTLRSAKASYLPSASASGTGSALDPDLAELSGGQNPQYSASGSVQVSQVVFSPGANANIGISRSLLEAGQANLRAAELDLTLDVANAYFTALVLKANLQIQAQNLEVTQRNLTTAVQNFEAGQSGRGDVLRLQSEASNDQQAVIEAINQLEQAFYAINQLVDNPINREIDIVDERLSVQEEVGYQRLQARLDDPSSRVQFEDFLVAEALAQAPELAALEHNLVATDRSIALNGLQRFLPTLSLIGKYDRTFEQGGVGLPPPGTPSVPGYYSVALGASISLFDSNLRNIDRQTARIQRDQLVLNRSYTEAALERQVRDVVLELVNQIASIELSQVSETAAAEALELIETAYANGAVSIAELLDAQASLLQAQLARASASYNFLSTSMVLGRLVGHFFILSTDAENDRFNERFEAFRASRAR